MLVYPSGIDVSSSALRVLSARLTDHRWQRGTRWRQLAIARSLDRHCIKHILGERE